MSRARCNSITLSLFSLSALFMFARSTFKPLYIYHYKSTLTFHCIQGLHFISQSNSNALLACLSSRNADWEPLLLSFTHPRVFPDTERRQSRQDGMYLNVWHNGMKPWVTHVTGEGHNVSLGPDKQPRSLTAPSSGAQKTSRSDWQPQI